MSKVYDHSDLTSEKTPSLKDWSGTVSRQFMRELKAAVNNGYGHMGVEELYYTLIDAQADSGKRERS